MSWRGCRRAGEKGRETAATGANLVNGKRGISEAKARALAGHFGVSVEFFM